MGHSCLASRLLAAAALGYLGAGPIHNVVPSWLVAVVALVITYIWSARLSHGDCACAMPLDQGSAALSPDVDTVRISSQPMSNEQEQRT